MIYRNRYYRCLWRYDAGLGELRFVLIPGYWDAAKGGAVMVPSWA